MKLSDYLDNLGRPMAYYPGLARALGDVKEAVFVCQLAYWRGKEQDPDGWIYKTREEIEQETALTYKEQLHVRDSLKGKKLLEEHYARTEHRMYFRIDWDAVHELWEEHLTKSKLPKHLTKSKLPPAQRENGSSPKVNSPSDQSSPGSLPKVISLNGISENTAEITSEITREGDGISLSNIWEQVLEQVQPDTPRASFRAYVQPSQAVRYDGNGLTVLAPSEEARAWLESRLTTTAQNLLVGILNHEVRVSFVIAEQVPA